MCPIRGHHRLLLRACSAHDNGGEDQDGDDREIDATDDNDQRLAKHENADDRCLVENRREVGGL
jgi:hypothetical protein